MSALKGQLERVLSLFIERYRLRPSDDSRGVDAIKTAIAAGDKADIVGLRRMLTEEYNLYPHYQGLVDKVFDEIAAHPPEVAVRGLPAPPVESAPERPRRGRAAPVVDEPTPDESSPEEPPR